MRFISNFSIEESFLCLLIAIVITYKNSTLFFPLMHFIFLYSNTCFWFCFSIYHFTKGFVYTNFSLLPYPPISKFLYFFTKGRMINWVGVTWVHFYIFPRLVSVYIAYQQNVILHLKIPHFVFFTCPYCFPSISVKQVSGDKLY